MVSHMVCFNRFYNMARTFSVESMDGVLQSAVMKFNMNYGKVTHKWPIFDSDTRHSWMLGMPLVRKKKWHTGRIIK